MSIQENDLHICGGFIYNSKIVITTASCVKGRGPATLKVSVNDYKFINSDETGEEKVAVFRITPHENYTAEPIHLNDIAVVELANDIQLDNIPADMTTAPSKPSCINYDEVLPENTEGTASGWGLSEPDGPISTTLKIATVQIEADSASCKADPAVGFTSSTMICTTNGAATTALCNSDDGAPLVVMNDAGKPIVVGIYSSTIGDKCVATSPSVFTRLSVFYAWLAKYAGSQPADCTSLPLAGEI